MQRARRLGGMVLLWSGSLSGRLAGVYPLGAHPSSHRLRPTMSENISKGAQPEESGDDSESQDRTIPILVHLLLLFGVAVVAAFTADVISQGFEHTMDPMGDVSLVVLGLTFAAYTVISSLGVIRWRSLTAVFGMHGAAMVISVPGGILLLLLGLLVT